MAAHDDGWARTNLVRELVPSFLLLVVAGLALRTALSWPARASLFPRWISVCIIVLLVAHVVGTIWRCRPRRAAVTDAAPSSVDISVDLRGKQRGAVQFALYVAAFGVAVVVLGFGTGAFLSSFVYTRLAQRDSWGVSLAVAGSTLFLVWLLDTVFGLSFRLGRIY